MERNIFFSELQILKDIAVTLNECTELDTMLNTVLKKLLHVTSLETGWIFLFDDQGAYRLVAAESLPPALKNAEHDPMNQGDCWCVNRFTNGELLKASNIMSCKRLEKAKLNNWGETNGLTYHATVPLSAGDEQFGLLNVAVTNKERFEREELALLESVAYQIGTALKRINLLKREHEMKIVEERNRLARDLHDSVNQLLYSVNVMSGAGKKMTKEQSIQDIFTDIQKISQHAQAEMKALIWQLRPEGLENGLVSALKTYGEMLGLRVDVTVVGVSSLPIKLEEVLWRIGQEAFQNTLKYSGVNTVFLHITYTKEKVMMQIADYGVGFHYLSSAELPTIGLKSIEERVKALQGKLAINSSLGKGTSITVELPYKGV